MNKNLKFTEAEEKAINSISYTIGVDKESIIGRNESTNLTKVNLSSCKIKDLTTIIQYLKTLDNMTELNLSNNQITDISPISELTKLTILQMDENNISDIYQIKNLKKLISLSIKKNQIGDISCLADLYNLTYINFTDNIINDIKSLSELTELQTICLSNNQISDISPIYNLRNLTHLYLWNNQVKELPSFKNMTKLIFLVLSGNTIADLSELKDLKQIETLYLLDNKIENISALKGLVKIQVLWLGNNQISDISPLKDLFLIEELDLHKNSVVDISPISELRKLVRLQISDNKITNIAPLKNLSKLKQLYLSNNQIVDVSLLIEFKELDSLTLQYNPIKKFPEWTKDSNFQNILWKDVVNKHEGFFFYTSDESFISFFDNPIINIPIDIIKQGKSAIRKYFNDINSQLLTASLVGKITKIQIKNLNQFHDLSLDLTVPEGHEKHGQALDKVCFIGQSGTGKSTLLNVIRFFADASQPKTNVEVPNIEKAEIEIHYFIQPNIKIGIKYQNQKFNCQIIENPDNLSFEQVVALLNEQKKLSSQTLIFPDVIKNINLISVWETISDVLRKYDTGFANKIYNQVSQTLRENETKGTRFLYSPDNTEHNLTSVWEKVISEIKQYNEEFTNKTLEYTKTVLKNPRLQDDENKKLQQWIIEHPNPLKDLADKCLDRLLNQFGVRVKTEIENVNEIPFITLETFDGSSLQLEHWSSGTKQVIFRAMPLYWFKPQNTIVLFDEVENSLYPDIQRLVVDFYTSLGENCQYFFSTHSPVIASSFEGYEIVKLKFNESGKVDAPPMFEGDRTIDNYFLNPRLLRWDGIYQRIMDLEPEGNDERRKLLPKAARLRKQLENMQEEQKEETPEYQSKAAEYIKLARKLGWEV